MKSEACLALVLVCVGCGGGAVQARSPRSDGPGANLTAYPPGAPTSSAGYSDDDPTALLDFRDALTPYGTWQEDATYGIVWSPTQAGTGFVPYVTKGRWAYDDGFVWLSEYPWGAIPFHYGRWVMREQGGWAWVPGRAYAGAHVAWRSDEEGRAVGWGPLPPSWVWRQGPEPKTEALSPPPPSPFVFAPVARLFDADIGSVLIGGDELNRVAPRAAPVADGGIGGGLGSPGPSLSFVTTHGGKIASPARTSAGALADAGLARAWAYARPETATALGAHARTERQPVRTGSTTTTTGGPLPPLPSMAPRYARPDPPVVRWSQPPILVYRGYLYDDPYYYYPSYYSYYGPRRHSSVRFGVFFGYPHVVYHSHY
jgi:hypothetical protein